MHEKAKYFFCDKGVSSNPLKSLSYRHKRVNSLSVLFFFREYALPWLCVSFNGLNSVYLPEGENIPSDLQSKHYYHCYYLSA